ncbi:MAG: hypothetical protein IIB77_10650 [Proteobacteria bacterium]|nr:hypothetical protein [Pseudomonadota bacterium]
MATVVAAGVRNTCEAPPPIGACCDEVSGVCTEDVDQDTCESSGGRFGGDRVSIAPTIRYRIGETFRSEFSINYNDFDLPVPNGQFTANLARLRLSSSFTPTITLQALVQYNENSDEIGTNIRFSWLQSANAGLYIVYNEVDERGVGALPTGREVIIKYSRIFDVFK